MPETTSERLDRILYILPLAARRGGASLAELAAALGCEPVAVLRDLEEVTARAYYDTTGATDQLQILIEGDRVQVWSPHEFNQPTRLSPQEGLALQLGLRILASEASPDRREHVLALAHTLAQQLVADTAGMPDPTRGVTAREESQTYLTEAHDRIESPLLDRLQRSRPPAHAGRAAPVSLDVGDDGFRSALAEAATRRVRCHILYLRPGQAAPAMRDVAPYLLVYATGAWYVLGHDAERDAVRAFRMDRMLDVEVTSDAFDVPADFDAATFIGTAGVYRSAGTEVEVTVSYSKRVARWIAERIPVEERPDGSVIARHRVGDPDWLVRHVLRYGADARVLEPADMRDRVASAASRLIA